MLSKSEFGDFSSQNKTFISMITHTSHTTQIGQPVSLLTTRFELGVSSSRCPCSASRMLSLTSDDKRGPVHHFKHVAFHITASVWVSVR